MVVKIFTLEERETGGLFNKWNVYSIASDINNKQAALITTALLEGKNKDSFFAFVKPSSYLDLNTYHQTLRNNEREIIQINTDHENINEKILEPIEHTLHSILNIKTDAHDISMSVIYEILDNNTKARDTIQKLQNNDSSIDAKTKTIINAIQNNSPVLNAELAVAYSEWKDVIESTSDLTSITGNTDAISVNLQGSNEELMQISDLGITDPKTQQRRGGLKLNLAQMHTIRDYFYKEKNRPPTDIELETLAQTWSEHCKHIIFSSPIDEIKDGLYKHYIQRATNEIRAKAGNKDLCVSVFKDNAGGVKFGNSHVVSFKAETHNSPSAINPFDGAMTGILGVNRDIMGFGMGALPIANAYCFCLPHEDDHRTFYKTKSGKETMLPPHKIINGVIKGVGMGGNCSGIPTIQGQAYFHKSYRAKPLVFCATVGIMPNIRNGKSTIEKRLQVGDYIVTVGGNTGRDAIHGATLSSTSMDENINESFTQGGDPFMQKKVLDMLIKYAAKEDLYSSITDCGAGGFSSAVGEMAQQTGGFRVNIDQVPLKYSNIAPWEIWISESQERMILGVPKQNYDRLLALSQDHGVPCAIIGEFTDSGQAQITHKDATIMDMSMHFLHECCPKAPLKTSAPEPTTNAHKPTTTTKPPTDIAQDILKIISRPNIRSRSHIVKQYDHEVQGTSLLKPIQGINNICADSAAIKPLFDSEMVVAISQGLTPRYNTNINEQSDSNYDTYNMASCAIDTAVRNLISIGIPLNTISLLDNFCWCQSLDPKRLWQLKRTAQACYDFAVAFGTPFISGKDSMFNDFSGYDEQKKEAHLSVIPTLLISSMGIGESYKNIISLDAKEADDSIYIIGQHKDELSGSEYESMHNQSIDSQSPMAIAEESISVYTAHQKLVERKLLSSSISINIGGPIVAICKKIMANNMGAILDFSQLEKLSTASEQLAGIHALFTETQGRIAVTVNPAHDAEFRKILDEMSMHYYKVGTVNKEPNIQVQLSNQAFTLKTSELNINYSQYAKNSLLN